MKELLGNIKGNKLLCLAGISALERYLLLFDFFVFTENRKA